MVVVGTKPEHFDSGWVRYEWRSFFNEIHSGRKPGGRIFTLAGSLDPSSLPYGLRQSQMLPFSPSSPQDAFEAVYQFLGRPTDRT